MLHMKRFVPNVALQTYDKCFHPVRIDEQLDIGDWAHSHQPHTFVKRVLRAAAAASMVKPEVKAASKYPKQMPSVS